MPQEFEKEPLETEEELFLSPEDNQEKQKDILPKIEEAEKLIINQRIVSWGFHIPTTPRTIDTIIVHSTYNASGDNPHSLEGVIYQFQAYKVTSHYLINREGTIYQLAPDNAIAYHAGESIMSDGSRKNLINNFSLGLELIYEETESPNEVQYQSLARLINYLRENYSIPTQNILGHSQIAPERKTDPWNFNWQKLNQILN